MKIIIAPDSFKESMDAFGAAQAMAEGARRAIPEAELDLCPLADGGDGTLAVLVHATEGSVQKAMVSDPLGHPVEARIGFLGKQSTAVVEMAQAAGLFLIPPRLRNPLNTTTFGIGQLIQAVLDQGADTIIVALGGSATVDAGCGCLQALGVLFFDGQGKPFRRPMTGADLGVLNGFDTSRIDEGLRSASVRCACDVSNPLVGSEGAARIFGPQKGAGPQDVEILEKNMERWADMVLRKTGRNLRHEPHTGAAGGLGAGLSAFLGASLESGFGMIAETIGLEGRIRRADLCLTGEGRLDRTSLSGKTTGRVADLCRKLGTAVICVPGQIADDAPRDLFDKVFGLAQDNVLSPDRFAHAGKHLADAAFRAVKSFSA